MSTVTNVIVTCPLEDGDGDDQAILDRLNCALQEAGGMTGAQRFVPLPQSSVGGEKNLECRVFVAAFNYFDDEKWLEQLRLSRDDWPDPEHVQVFVMRDEDDVFTEVLSLRFAGGAL